MKRSAHMVPNFHTLLTLLEVFVGIFLKTKQAGICSHLKSCKLILFSNSPLFTKALLGVQK